MEPLHFGKLPNEKKEENCLVLVLVYGQTAAQQKHNNQQGRQ
jgi:hypothetical protein